MRGGASHPPFPCERSHVVKTLTWCWAHPLGSAAQGGAASGCCIGRRSVGQHTNPPFTCGNTKPLLQRLLPVQVEDRCCATGGAAGPAGGRGSAGLRDRGQPARCRRGAPGGRLLCFTSVLLRVVDGAKDVVSQVAVVWARALDVGSTDTGSQHRARLAPTCSQLLLIGTIHLGLGVLTVDS
jgi:hypothetical protein